ncbi:hypothetical protein [Streptomyces sp. NPDC017941]|uniref:hypothetical protein n=1 Tax=Streptomyces sp. NPDC017941 TaxID=3365018 RepID=UPI0037B3BAFD
MAPRVRKTTKPRPAPTCPDCDGKGETTEAVRVGSRKSRVTEHRQTAMCLSCLGTGEAPATD